MNKNTLFLKNIAKYLYSGFTLAEVLVVIGVVAALTMPTIIQNQQKKL